MSNKNVYEDREERRQQNLERHTVICPNCGNPTLDHMTECPKCKGRLKPAVYQPLSDERIKKIRIITYTIGAIITIGVFVWMIFFR
ncbi:MAG: hypothetical protein IKD43_01070 [Clostridia bacterium]|nr:hypothetical protein [Clostridia bacterium]